MGLDLREEFFEAGHAFVFAQPLVLDVFLRPNQKSFAHKPAAESIRWLEMVAIVLLATYEVRYGVLREIRLLLDQFRVQVVMDFHELDHALGCIELHRFRFGGLNQVDLCMPAPYEQVLVPWREAKRW